MTFLTFAITKSEILKFQISPNEIELLRSTFKSTERFKVNIVKMALKNCQILVEFR